MIKNFSVLVVLLVLVGSVIGCGPKRPSFLPKTYPTTVKVTDGGIPIDGAKITLYPNTPLTSVVVVGTTNASGIAKIQSLAAANNFDGAPAGEYVVTVEKTPPGVVFRSGRNGETPQEFAARLAEHQAAIEAVRIIPAVLETKDNSPLKLTVSNKSELIVDISQYK